MNKATNKMRTFISDAALERRWRNNGIILTVNEHKKLLRIQKYRCCICQKHQRKLKYRLHIDHDHQDGKVRGLLCINCNALLGQARDSIEILESAKLYLLQAKKPKKEVLSYEKPVLATIGDNQCQST